MDYGACLMAQASATGYMDLHGRRKGPDPVTAPLTTIQVL